MPKITPTTSGLTLDRLRRDPSQLLSSGNIAEMKIFQSHDALARAVKSGRLPEPYRAGLHRLWEGRAVLQMLGAPVEIPGERPKEAA
jgi:hypothetical protein